MNKKEDVAYIVSEMRERAWKFTVDPEQAKILEDYANRIEAAAEHDLSEAYDNGYNTGWDDRCCNG